MVRAGSVRGGWEEANPIFSYYYGHRVYVDLNCRVVFFWNSFIILPKLELIWSDVAVIF